MRWPGRRELGLDRYEARVPEGIAAINLVLETRLTCFGIVLARLKGASLERRNALIAVLAEHDGRL